MFCGHQLAADYERIAELGSGLIELDALTKECSHNGVGIVPLQIAEVLQEWLHRDLESNSIPVSNVEKANLQIEFDTERHYGPSEIGAWWPGAKTKYYISCTLKCTGIIAANKQTYTAQHIAHEEWPDNYDAWKTYKLPNKSL